ncbi:Prolyl endopeptidase, partial [Strongyloides ratti]
PESNRFISGLNNMYFNFMNRSEFIKPIRNILNGYKKYTKQEFVSQFGDYKYYYNFDHLGYRSIIRRVAPYNVEEDDFINLNNYDREEELYIEDFAMSPSLKIMAYKINLLSGFLKIKFKYLNGKDLKDELSINSKTDYAFVLNDAGFIYSNYPTKLTSNGEQEVDISSQILFYHKFGTSQSVDKQIFLIDFLEETTMTAKLSDAGNLLLIKIQMNLNDTTAYYFSDLTNVRDIAHDIIPNHLIGKFDANYEYCFTIGDFAVFFVKKFGMKSSVVVTRIQSSENTVDTAEIILEEEEGLKIKNVYSVGKDFFVIIVVKKSQYFLKLYNKKALTLLKDIDVGPGVIEHAQAHISTNYLIYSFNNIVMPNAIYRYNFENVLNKGVNEIIKETLFKTEFYELFVDDFTIKTEYFKTKGCKSIPMIMIHNKNLNKNKNNPVIVEAYGDLSAAWHPQKSLAKMFFVKEFGGIWCIPGIRGIEGLGKKWTSDGKELKRKNSFDDFIYAIKHLIK